MKNYVIQSIGVSLATSLKVKEPEKINKISSQALSSHDMPSINIEDIKKNAEETSKKVEGVKVKFEEVASKVDEHLDDNDKQKNKQHAVMTV